jgi:hypothetical protein
MNSSEPEPTYENALREPGSVYRSPEAVAEDPNLSIPQKLRILQQWEYDVREAEVASEENMDGADSIDLARILRLQQKLGAVFDPEHHDGGKQGGSSIP